MQDGLIHQRSFEGHLQGVDARTIEDQDPMPLPRWGKGIRGQERSSMVSGKGRWGYRQVHQSNALHPSAYGFIQTRSKMGPSFPELRMG